MSLSRTKVFLRQYGIFYLCGLLTLLGLKYFYSQADSNTLRWILAPTARWVTLLNGIPFVYEPENGYANHSLRLLIAPACSGVRFMMIVIATLLFSFLHRMGSSLRRCLYWTLTSIAAAYPLTVLVNGLRISLSIYLPPLCEARGLYGSLLTPERLHTIIGVAVYLAALLLIHRLGDGLTRRRWAGSIGKQKYFSAEKLLLPRLLQPVFWYFFMVLGIPFLNRAYQKNGAVFTEYAALITLVSGIVMLPFFLGPLLKKLRRH